MKELNFPNLIESYLAGEMGDSDKLKFEHKLNGDRDLSNEVKLRRDTDKILENMDVISLRNKLSAIEKSKNNRNPVLRRVPVYTKYAGIIFGLILIGSVSLYEGKNLNGEQVLDRYYKTYEPLTAQRSGKVVANTDFKMALEFYNTHEYGKAAVLFSKVVDTNPRDMQSELLVGLSNFEDKKYTEAKKSFVNVINDNNNFFIESAKWYLALCYIKIDEKQKAVDLLEVIKKENGLYSKDAKKIIRRYK